MPSNFYSSPKWLMLKAKRLQYACNRCENCKIQLSFQSAQLHHITNRNYENPQLEDLRILCDTCHSAISMNERDKAALSEPLICGTTYNLYGVEYKIDTENAFDECDFALCIRFSRIDPRIDYRQECSSYFNYWKELSNIAACSSTFNPDIANDMYNAISNKDLEAFAEIFVTSSIPISATIIDSYKSDKNGNPYKNIDRKSISVAIL